MTLSINVKTAICDANINLLQPSLVNSVEIPIVMTAQSQYVFRLTCYDYITSTSSIVKHFKSTDRFFALLGNQTFQSGALVEVHNDDFNNSSDWASVDKLNGLICFKISLNTPQLLSDISGNSSKDYCLQVWCIDDVTDLPYLVSSTNVTVNNVAVEI